MKGCDTHWWRSVSSRRKHADAVELLTANEPYLLVSNVSLFHRSLLYNYLPTLLFLIPRVDTVVITNEQTRSVKCPIINFMLVVA
jgi:hypothetical protein